ncbi:MAG TPA: hypothetical protein VEY92_11485 [Pseudoxanthomonas sp.]|nr:hypothetical protein [Pseudoxanthomonas sp.]
MSDTTQCEQLRFLEGRWRGIAPDGTVFYEEYAFKSASEMRSTRFKDAAFDQATDGSVVSLADGVVTSTWNGFNWRASEPPAGKARFEPVDVPSASCWERTAEGEIQVIQRWTGESGKPRQYVIPMSRA